MEYIPNPTVVSESARCFVSMVLATKIDILGLLQQNTDDLACYRTFSEDLGHTKPHVEVWLAGWCGVPWFWTTFNTLVLALAFMSRIFRVLPIADLLRAEYCQNLLSIIFVSSDYAQGTEGRMSTELKLSFMFPCTILAGFTIVPIFHGTELHRELQYLLM